MMYAKLKVNLKLVKWPLSNCTILKHQRPFNRFSMKKSSTSAPSQWIEIGEWMLLHDYTKWTYCAQIWDWIKQANVLLYFHLPFLVYLLWRMADKACLQTEQVLYMVPILRGSPGSPVAQNVPYFLAQIHTIPNPGKRGRNGRQNLSGTGNSKLNIKSVIHHY